ncbi:MAG: hypothetical protein NC116_11340, partial [Clostridium sp.]|nr:hypothetical protein [Clostridium sp.]
AFSVTSVGGVFQKRVQRYALFHKHTRVFERKSLKTPEINNVVDENQGNAGTTHYYIIQRQRNFKVNNVKGGKSCFTD